MQNEVLGISIGVAIKGIAEIIKLKGTFENLKKSIKDSNGNLKTFSRDLAKIRLADRKILKFKADRESLKRELLSVTELLLRGGAIVAPIKLAMDYESSMADVKKVVDFTSKAEFNKFSNDLLGLSRSIPLSAQELATITASGGQLGIAKNDLMDFTKIVAKMGVAFDMSSADAGDSIASMMNVYSLGMKDVEKLGDTINHLSDNSAAKARDIVEAMKRIGGSAKVFGLSADEASALASSFIALGKPPQVAGTAINALLNKLQTAPKQGKAFQEALGKIGMDANYVKTMIQNNPQKALETFLSSLEGVNKNEKMSILTDLFGAEFSDDMALLVSSLDEYRKALKLSRDEAKNGSLDREFKNRSETTANSLQLLQNAVSELGINIGSVFLPAISKIAAALASFVNGIVNITSKVPGLTSVLGFLSAGFLLLKPVILAVKFASSYLKESWMIGMKTLAMMNIKIKQATVFLRNLNIVKRLSAVISNTYAAANRALAITFNFLKASIFTTAGAMKILRLALISTGIGALVVGIGMAAAWLIENWDKVKAWFSSFSDWLGKIFDPVVEWFKNIFGGFFDWISEKFAWISDTIGTVGDALGSAWKGTKEFFGFGDEEESKQESKQSDESFFSSMFGEKDAPQIKQTAKALATTSGNITINLNGGFNIATSEGRFDLSEFERALTQSVKRAIQRDQFNQANTEIRE
ncbi:phage tail tape measure protein [Campylobacter sp. FOBRC14]|uniref:phage tail tape measure protein n=1 Tax=Campylobacter sp. FOBRC14 TaxID=936554 RepID=UPI00027A368B|nr:phage tail tape measure protein [Campylobacter sp. FOBRC14]EJP75641.1 phage tail tape measure protein, TP901 family [Campylobacter sp. FOBRC14]